MAKQKSEVDAAMQQAQSDIDKYNSEETEPAVVSTEQPVSDKPAPTTRQACQEAMDAKHVEIDAAEAAVRAKRKELDALIRLHNRLPK